MGNATLNSLWVGSFKASEQEARQLQTKILLKAESLDIGELVSHVSSSANGLHQFMIMPTSSKETYPDNVAWEQLATYTAREIAGSTFSIKRLYVASI